MGAKHYRVFLTTCESAIPVVVKGGSSLHLQVCSEMSSLTYSGRKFAAFRYILRAAISSGYIEGYVKVAHFEHAEQRFRVAYGRTELVVLRY